MDSAKHSAQVRTYGTSYATYATSYTLYIRVLIPQLRKGLLEEVSFALLTSIRYVCHLMRCVCHSIRRCARAYQRRCRSRCPTACIRYACHLIRCACHYIYVGRRCRLRSPTVCLSTGLVMRSASKRQPHRASALQGETYATVCRLIRCICHYMQRGSHLAPAPCRVRRMPPHTLRMPVYTNRQPHRASALWGDMIYIYIRIYIHMIYIYI